MTTYLYTQSNGEQVHRINNVDVYVTPILANHSVGGTDPNSIVGWGWSCAGSGLCGDMIGGGMHATAEAAVADAAEKCQECHVSLMPLDVGFDPRVTRTTVHVPRRPVLAVAVPATKRQPETVIRGRYAQVLGALRNRGYVAK